MAPGFGGLNSGLPCPTEPLVGTQAWLVANSGRVCLNGVSVRIDGFTAQLSPSIAAAGRRVGRA
jgi:hypothetical protein